MKFLLLKAICFLFLGNLFLTLSLAGAWTFYFWQVLFFFKPKSSDIYQLPHCSQTLAMLRKSKFSTSASYYFQQQQCDVQFDRSWCNDIIIFLPQSRITYSFSLLPALWSLSNETHIFFSMQTALILEDTSLPKVCRQEEVFYITLLLFPVPNCRTDTAS